MATHSAIVTVAKRQPLQIVKVPTVPPEGNEVLVKVEYSSTGPLELHQCDGGLLVQHPHVLGDAHVGTVVKLGPAAKRFKVGDKVFGYASSAPKQKSYQTYATVPENLIGKLPGNIAPESAVVVPVNLVTAFHTLITELGVSLPWPRPDGYKPPADQPVLIWGGSSSVGQYTIQVLKYYNFSTITAVASKAQHELLKELGAHTTVDYRDKDIVEQLTSLGELPLIVDCIGSQNNSVAPISKVAKAGSKVAIMMPVIVRDATDDIEPVYSMEPGKVVEWEAGVDVIGVRTHFWQQNEFLSEHLQTEIIPDLVAKGAIKPNKIRVVEGKNMLERAQKCIDLLRARALSAERVSWQLDHEKLGL